MKKILVFLAITFLASCSSEQGCCSLEQELLDKVSAVCSDTDSAKILQFHVDGKSDLDRLSIEYVSVCSSSNDKCAKGVDEVDVFVYSTSLSNDVDMLFNLRESGRLHGKSLQVAESYILNNVVASCAGLIKSLN